MSLISLTSCSITTSAFLRNVAMVRMSNNTPVASVYGGAITSHATSCRYNATYFVANRAVQIRGGASSAAYGGALAVQGSGSVRWYVPRLVLLTARRTVPWQSPSAAEQPHLGILLRALLLSELVEEPPFPFPTPIGHRSSFAVPDPLHTLTHPP